MRQDTDTPASTQAARAGRREWIGLAVIALPCLLYSMDLTVLHLAVPAAHRATSTPERRSCCGSSTSTASWSPGSLITMGTLGDRIGRRRLLLIGAAAFGAASVLAAFSTSAEMLIAARALLGVAGATLAPSTLSLIRNMFHDPRQRTVAIGVWVDELLGRRRDRPARRRRAAGVLLVGLGVPAGRAGDGAAARGRAAAAARVPRSRAPGRLRPASAALSLVAVLAVIYGLKQLAEDGAGAGRRCCRSPAGVAVGVAFVRRQRRLADPLIDLRLFRAPAFSASLGANTLAIFVVVRRRSCSSRSTCSSCSACRRSRRACGRCPRPRVHRRLDARAGPGAPLSGPCTRSPAAWRCRAVGLAAARAGRRASAGLAALIARLGGHRFGLALGRAR